MSKTFKFNYLLSQRETFMPNIQFSTIKEEWELVMNCSNDEHASGTNPEVGEPKSWSTFILSVAEYDMLWILI